MAIALSRPLPGSRQHNFYPTHRDTSVGSLDSAFQLQEYLAYLIQNDPHDIRRIVSLPKNLSAIDDRGRERYLVQEDEKDEPVDESCWIYEHLRRLAQDLNHPLITTLQQECTRETCPEMKAGEWLFLCVAHGNGPNVEKCCAIDYILHTLDSATALLNSPKAFPSRITIPPNSHRHFSSLARRLGRIFGHAYYQHREAFEQSEADTSLYSRFLALAAMYDLVPPDFLDIPPRESHGFGGESDDIEISRARPEEFGGRGSSSPLGRSRTDTMIRAEGFSLPAEEFEEHIPQSEHMESVELPTSFYHEREEADEPNEPEVELTMSEEHVALRSEQIHSPVSIEEDPAHGMDPSSFQHEEELQLGEKEEAEGWALGEGHGDSVETAVDAGAPYSTHKTEEPKEPIDEPRETSAEPPVESDQASISIPVSGDVQLEAGDSSTEQTEEKGLQSMEAAESSLPTSSAETENMESEASAKQNETAATTEGHDA